jgi:hypothetical protein
MILWRDRLQSSSCGKNHREGVLLGAGLEAPLGLRHRHDRLKMTAQAVGTVENFKIAHHFLEHR